jgi:hypothetical protein
VSIFPQSGAMRLNTPTCRYCAEPAEPGADLCAYHASEAFRLITQPQRAGYHSRAYLVARRAAIRRARGRCEACGVNLDRRIDSSGANGHVICETHHKDENPLHNPPDGSNLTVCCLDCHNGSRRPAGAP